ncbi:FkbM family methyltransferase [Mameliella sediminis]|uniref:FkbM family methyltransferase n=1 Tax=Mameliella sediminis TaxID=2836866 RepID=UPI001C471165|nr:FkbM family methyltransferase [Mameliella sediminis]MBV7396358.1 FkbM family methyltransferase [Mameliella sediminis]
MQDVTVAARCRGVDVPISPFLTETRQRRIEAGRYEGDEIAGALSVVRPGDRVLELGAGLGVVGAVIARNADPAAMLSFEANPDLIPHIRILHRLNGLEDRIELRNQVLMSGPDRPETRRFYLRNSFLGSSLVDAENRNTREVEVPTAALDDVLREFRPDVLIMDIEGGELEFLEQAELRGIRAVVIEFHPGVYGTQGAKTCKDRLRAMGFQKDETVSTRFVWTCSRNIIRLEPPSPAGGWSCQIARLKHPQVLPPTHRSHVQPSGVLSAAGQVVPHATTWRNARLLTPPPKPVKDAERLPGRWLWGGVLWRYFPHFVTESVTRLWALEHIDANQFDGILFTPKNPTNTDPLPPFHAEFLRLMGCDLPIHEARAPCVPDELIVPGQGFGLGEISRGTDRFIESVALRFAQQVAPKGPEKLYISRSRLGAGRGSLLGEERLEALLAEQGYEIFHPQAHSLTEQVARYKAAKQIVAAEGSALHFLAFVARPDQRVAMILRRRSGATKHISAHLESFSGRPPLWIETLRRAWMPKGEVRKRLAVGEPDFAAVQAALIENGFVAPGPVWQQPEEAAMRAELGDGFTLLEDEPRLAG